MTEYGEGYFSTRYAPDARRDGVWREIVRYLRRDMGEPRRVLDLGAGYCGFINHAPGDEKFALDIFEGVAAHAASDVDVRIGSCIDLSAWESDSLDCVFASNLFEHLEFGDFERAMGEACRVLRPGGRLLVIQPNFATYARNYFDDYTHRLIFTHTGLATALEAHGLRVVRVERGLLPASFKSRLPARPWMVGLYLRLPIRPLARQMYVCAEKPTVSTASQAKRSG